MTSQAAGPGDRAARAQPPSARAGSGPPAARSAARSRSRWRCQAGLAGVARLIPLACVALAAALALLPPFGSSDHLSYAAHGRMVVTGRNPCTATPATPARLGDRVARAKQDGRGSPSGHGRLDAGGQLPASLIGGRAAAAAVADAACGAGPAARS